MAQTSLISWDIYEIHTTQTEIQGVMLRGRIRKLGLENDFNVLCENAADEERCVRFAVLHQADPAIITDYLKRVISDVNIELIMDDIANPVLSKLNVNKEGRYTL